jgi:hypothetical protein
MNPPPEPSPRRPLRALLLLAVLYAAGLGFVTWQPSLLPRLAAPLLEWCAPRIGRLHLACTPDRSGALQLRADSRRLEHLETREQRGFAVQYDATLDGRIVNRYLVLTLTLLLGWPGFSRRQRLVALGPALALVVACSVFDLLVQAYWQELQMVSRSVASMGIPATDTNTRIAADLAVYARRLQAVKQFLSGGGRPFLAVVSFLAALGAARCVSPAAPSTGLPDPDVDPHPGASGETGDRDRLRHNGAVQP